MDGVGGSGGESAGDSVERQRLGGQEEASGYLADEPEAECNASEASLQRNDRAVGLLYTR